MTVVTDRVDVLICGTGFGGSISAYRLAELYRAAGADPAGILVLERGRRFATADFRQSTEMGYNGSLYQVLRGVGANILTANLVGGASNVYQGVSMRAPTETFERRDRRPGDGPERRMWPKEISRATLNPFYARAERGLRVARPPWSRISKAGGVFAAAMREAGHTADRLPLAINVNRCQESKWCNAGCIFGAINRLPSNYLGTAERAGVRIRPNSQAESIRPAAPPYRFGVRVSPMDNEGPAPTRAANTDAAYEIECKVLILACGAMGDPQILMRSRLSLPALSAHVGRHLGVNGDHVTSVQLRPEKVRSVLGLPGYHDFHKGRQCSMGCFDFHVGRREHKFDGTRFILEELYLSPATQIFYDDGRDPPGEPSWWGLQKKRSLKEYPSRVEVLALVEDTQDGHFIAPPPSGASIRTTPGPLTLAPFTYKFSEQSAHVRERADTVIRSVFERKGLGRFIKATGARGPNASHPLGGCRMADSRDLGVTGHAGNVFGYEGLYCIDSSIVPTSLTVNPSLTIAALAERCSQLLIRRGADFGLPAMPAGFRPGTPAELVV